MDRFAQFITMARETRAKSLAPRSESTYQAYIDAYSNIMATEFAMDAFPLTEEKITGFLMYQKTKGRCYSTILCYVTAFSWYFRTNQLDNLVNSVSFKQFKTGLKRTMMGCKYPHQKAPFEFDFFGRLHLSMHLQAREDRRLFLLMTLSYHFFMRISEILNLKVGDLKLDAENELLECRFTRSKTDQFGEGTTCYISVNESITNPVHYMDVLVGESPESSVCPWKEATLLSRLRAALKNIGVDPANYSWHSFRRGGAFRASERGVQDSVIKKHGRWNSEAYQRYAIVDAVRAGKEITTSLTE